MSSKVGTTLAAMAVLAVGGLSANADAALIGLDLNVEGEENLWSHRPAVFVFNHQSKADVVIMTSLLRRDIAGVGKQEIRKMPVIGKVMELAGTVYIDRANSSSAIEAMKPLIDVMRKEGKSVVIAPEGTRTVSPKLKLCTPSSCATHEVPWCATCMKVSEPLISASSTVPSISTSLGCWREA